MISTVLANAQDVTWAIDLADGPAALAIRLLLERGQRVLFRKRFPLLFGAV